MINNESEYEDYSREIQELTTIIQKDIVQLNRELEHLQKVRRKY